MARQLLTSRRLAAPALLLVAALLLGGCGGSDESASPTTHASTAATTTRQTPRPLRIGLVVEQSADDALGPSAREGLRRAEERLGARARVRTSSSRARSVAELSELAAQGYDLVLGVGSGMAGPLEQVANEYPDARFAAVGLSQAAMPSQPGNVRGLLFESQEAGYLAGYLAGLLQQDAGSNPTISTVGGSKTPAVDRYLAGFRAGARKADPAATILSAYAQGDNDQARCKEIALGQIAQGSNIVFQVAGRCGLGALEAAQEKNVWGIGSGADQGSLGPYVLTSAVENADVAVFETIQEVQRNRFSGGEDRLYDVASGGVGIGRVSPEVPADVLASVQALQDDLAAGKIGPIPETVG